MADLDALTSGADANQDGGVNALDITEVEMILSGLDLLLLKTWSLEREDVILRRHVIRQKPGAQLLILLPNDSNGVKHSCNV